MSDLVQFLKEAAANLAPFTSLGSLAIAAAAFVLSLRNRLTSNEALKIAKTQESRRKPRLSVESIDGGTWTEAKSGDRLVGISVLVTNESDSDGAVKLAELHVTYGADYLVVLRSAGIGLVDKKDFELPTSMKANESKAGWVWFRIKKGALAQMPIGSYLLRVIDSRGIHVDVHSLSLTPKGSV